LGNGSISANALFNDNYVRPRRQLLLNILNRLLDYMYPGLGCLAIQTSNNIAFTLTDAAQAQILTINERRELAGKGPIPGGDIIAGLTPDLPAPDIKPSRTQTDLLTKPLSDPKF